MFNMIIGEYFLRDGLNTTESPKVFHCAPVSPTSGHYRGRRYNYGTDLNYSTIIRNMLPENNKVCSV